jgi:hypothetical protein
MNSFVLKNAVSEKTRSGDLQSADAHEKPLSDGDALRIVPSWPMRSCIYFLPSTP